METKESVKKITTDPVLNHTLLDYQMLEEIRALNAKCDALEQQTQAIARHMNIKIAT